MSRENAIAKDIEKFKTSANSNHGYYIGRYEAGVDYRFLSMVTIVIMKQIGQDIQEIWKN